MVFIYLGIYIERREKEIEAMNLKEKRVVARDGGMMGRGKMI